MQNEILMITISNMATHIPVYLVWLAGIFLAIDSRKRNPRSSLFAILAIAFMFALNLIGIFMSTLPMRLNKQGYTMLNIGMILSVANIAMSILSAGGWGLLLAAIFSERHTLSSLNSHRIDSE
jgi:hypothetical protein